MDFRQMREQLAKIAGHREHRVLRAHRELEVRISAITRAGSGCAKLRMKSNSPSAPSEPGIARADSSGASSSSTSRSILGRNASSIAGLNP
jgi:hypothetical protein